MTDHHHRHNVTSKGGILPKGTREQRARALQMHWLDYSDAQIATRLMSEAAHGERKLITPDDAREMRQQAFREQRAD